MTRILSSEEQIQKLQPAMRLANDASKSNDVDRRLGAFLLHAGIADFLAIQAARLVEQIILKSQLAEGKEPAFQPHSDTYFYDHQPPISTRGILKGIGKLLPFQSPDPSHSDEAKRITELANQMIDAGVRFLNYRNPIVHHIGNPKKTLDDLTVLCDLGNVSFHEFRDSHKAFFEVAAPYRFGDREIQYFRSRGIIDF
jgi:hypothetical protein